MLDIELLRNNPERVKKTVADKGCNPALVDEFLALDTAWRGVQKELDEARAAQKKLSDARDIEGAKANKLKIKELEEKSAQLSLEREDKWIRIPNLASEDTPIGKNEDENVELRRWGELPKFDFTPKDYMDLGELHDIIDTERASRVSGARFGYLKGAAALMEFALVKFGMDTLTDEKILREVADSIEPGYPATPFIPVVPPVMIKPDVYRRTARLNPGDEEERYYLPADNMYLIGSAEHTLCSMHIDEILKEEQLPLRYVGFSTAFRREAGSYGKDTRGILRVHQFDKLEMESFTTPEMSQKEQDFIVALQEYMMRALKLPHRTIICCTGDMGNPDYRHIDIEAWFPAQNKYRETHSADLMIDYQARRLNTKVRRADGSLVFAHMNDATAFSQRPILAILENNQLPDGRVVVPEVLREYLKRDIIG